MGEGEGGSSIINGEPSEKYKNGVTYLSSPVGIMAHTYVCLCLGMFQ